MAVKLMRAFLGTVIIGGLLLLASISILVWPQSFARAADAAIYAAGDSICVGLANAAGIKSVARAGVPTREVPVQLRVLPEGATIYLCSGTNDAPARLSGFQSAVGDAVATAKDRKQKLIWIGPMRSHLWWDRYSDHADTFLALAVPNYVSLRSVDWRRDELARDGIHLTPKGYRRLAMMVKP